jgi:glycine cleavage system aminomethyltransferase T
VKLEKGDFNAREALVAAKSNVARRLRTIGVGGSEYVPIYGGEAVSSGGTVAGRLRSCAYGFTARKNLAYSYLPVELKPGEQVEVEVFGKMLPALVLQDKTFATVEEKHHAS